jgi:hypothetical protein
MFVQKRLNNDLIIICAMGKKIEEAEVKKECPSCGLGVALDSTVCEFCGWDFEEEDEWILQIEKLERDLMVEKQTFEPGTVNQRIESTLHNPSLERIDIIRARQEQSASEQTAAETSRPPTSGRSGSARPASPTPSTHGEQRGLREARPSEMEIKRQPIAPPQEREEMPKPVSTRFAREASPQARPAVQQNPAKVRRVRTVKAPQADEGQQENADTAPVKTRLVRKVKK